MAQLGIEETADLDRSSVGYTARVKETRNRSSALGPVIVAGLLAMVAAVTGSYVGGMQAGKSLRTQLAEERARLAVEQRRGAYESFLREAHPISSSAKELVRVELTREPYETAWDLRRAVSERSDALWDDILQVRVVGSVEAADAARDFEMWAGSYTGMKLDVGTMYEEMDSALRRFVQAARHDLSDDPLPIEGPLVKD